MHWLFLVNCILFCLFLLLFVAHSEWNEIVFSRQLATPRSGIPAVQGWGPLYYSAFFSPFFQNFLKHCLPVEYKWLQYLFVNGLMDTAFLHLAFDMTFILDRWRHRSNINVIQRIQAVSKLEILTNRALIQYKDYVFAEQEIVLWR